MAVAVYVVARGGCGSLMVLTSRQAGAREEGGKAAAAAGRRP
jgi:hypothetical protein